MTILILTILVLFGFRPQRRRFIDFLFYNIPLDKGTLAIHNYIKSNANFKILTTDTIFGQLRNMSTKVQMVNDITKKSDSAFIGLYPKWTTICDGKKMRAITLTNIWLTLYFKTSQLRDKEFDAINKILNKRYRFMYYTSISKQDSLHE